jgi:formylmethanofuran dehydrogenase subunit C
MRRGVIAVAGSAGDFTGVMMLAGTIFVFGALGLRTGAGMKRGAIVLFSGDGGSPSLLPTFKFDCTYRPVWIDLYLRQLREWGVSVPEASMRGLYRRYSGDFVEHGKGEILVWTSP